MFDLELLVGMLQIMLDSHLRGVAIIDGGYVWFA